MMVQTETRPADILILMCDQLNPHMVGYAGDPLAPTPNIDRLAAAGTVFTNAYTVSPVCMPSRASFISALYPHNHGLWSNMTDYFFPTKQAGLFRDLKAAGYSTAQIGKFHYFLPPWGDDLRDYQDYYEQLGLDYAEEVTEPNHTPFYQSAYSDHLKANGLYERYLGDIAERFQNGDFSVSPAPIPSADHPDSFTARRAIDYIERHPLDQTIESVC
jgi:arylsulfatase A-like enzyme